MPTPPKPEHLATYRGAADAVGVTDASIRKAVKANRLTLYHTADGKPLVDIRQVRKLYAAG